MRILFTKLRHIGDNLLVTPTIVATRRKYPDAEIWLAVRRGTEAILAGCPEIDRVVVTARPEEGRRTRGELAADLATTARIATTGFDYAFELGDNDRGRTLVMASRAKVRCTNSYERPEGEPLTPFWKGRFNRLVTTGHGPVHQVIRDYNAVREVLSLPDDPPPLRFAPGARKAHGLPLPAGEPYAVIHPATRWPSKSWPADRWRTVVEKLLARFPRIVVSCGPDPSEIAVAESLREGCGERVLSSGGALAWARVADLLGGADLFIGVDTAAMHLAAATGCPSVALFGNPPSYQFRPWKVTHRVVRARDGMPEKERILLPGEQLMGEITTGAVLEAVDGLMAEVQTEPRVGTEDKHR
jgi:heptosyltransferase-3